MLNWWDGDFWAVFTWIIYSVPVVTIWLAQGGCTVPVIGLNFKSLPLVFCTLLHIFCPFKSIWFLISPKLTVWTHTSVYVLYMKQKRLFSTKVAVKWNLNWDFGNGWWPVHRMITLCFWENTSNSAEAINLSLACTVSLLCNQNSALRDDGIAHLIRRCQRLAFT